MKKKILGAGILALSSVMLLSACGSSNESGSSDSVDLVYVEWDTEVASTSVVSEVLRDMGYEVNMTPLDNAVMWEAVANDEADGMVAAWLPMTHEAQYDRFADQVEDLGPNLDGGAKLGLVVPSYMDVDSIADLSDQADQTIVGIDPGAGVVSAAENTVETYDNLADWNVMTSSGGAMTAQLGQSLQNEDEIIITGWSPHWMFSRYDLKYLEDPEGTMGGEESIHTMVRQGLAEDKPEVYSLLDNFQWEVEDIESVMLEVEDGVDPTQAARNWIEANEETVNSWKE